MPQIPVPKLPCAKLGIVNSKSGTYYYVQTYTHHYDKVKKRSVRDSQKTIGTVTGGDKYGVIKFKQFFLDEHPELENFIVSWTKDGFSYKLADEEDFSTIIERPIEKKLAGASWALQKLMGDSGIGDALRETFNSYKRNLKLASLVIYMVIKRTNAMHHYEPFSKITWLPWSRPMNDGQITRLFQSVTYDEVIRFFNVLNRNYCQKYGKDFYKRVFVALDSTSVSTYSNNLSLAEYGHNKDGDDIPQINYMLVCDEVTGLPIYAKVYKGNVVDVTTVKNLLAELKIMHSRVTSSNNKEDFVPTLIFVTDRGYDSEDNLQYYLIHHYSFVIRSMLRSKWVKDVLLENYDKLMEDNSLDTYTSQHMCSAQVEYKYDDFPVDKRNKTTKLLLTSVFTCTLMKKSELTAELLLRLILLFPEMNTISLLISFMQRMKLLLLNFCLSLNWKTLLSRSSSTTIVSLILKDMQKSLLIRLMRNLSSLASWFS